MPPRQATRQGPCWPLGMWLQPPVGRSHVQPTRRITTHLPGKTAVVSHQSLAYPASAVLPGRFESMARRCAICRVDGPMEFEPGWPPAALLLPTCPSLPSPPPGPPPTRQTALSLSPLGYAPLLGGRGYLPLGLLWASTPGLSPGACGGRDGPPAPRAAPREPTAATAPPEPSPGHHDAVRRNRGCQPQWQAL